MNCFYDKVTPSVITIYNDNLHSSCYFELFIAEFNIFSVHFFLLACIESVIDVFMFAQGFRKVRTLLKSSGQIRQCWSWMIFSKFTKTKLGNEIFIDVQSALPCWGLCFLGFIFLSFVSYRDCKYNSKFIKDIVVVRTLELFHLCIVLSPR